MGPSAAGAIVLITFPFSDLSDAKLRPAVALAPAGRGDWIVCQITSRPYGDDGSIEIHPDDFAKGSLARVSYVRPLKLFTASPVLVRDEVGRLKIDRTTQILAAITDTLARGVSATLVWAADSDALPPAPGPD